ncbi:hypothetical protein HPB47_018339 [Ixodes persulcatus]|uniref:Uncharacterized protein n=1 Tax=Ixodes persulcatus TaxID=34615 RepID=A0AC60QPI2_IXOPE|nr:hypothetical protein HPB47_018339 [Ixodes persulcatus]
MTVAFSDARNCSVPDKLFHEGCLGVTFRRLSVPRSVRKAADTQVVLNCEFRYNEKGLKLLVKWFCNDSLEPVYQWIPRDEVTGNFRSAPVPHRPSVPG